MISMALALAAAAAGAQDSTRFETDGYAGLVLPHVVDYQRTERTTVQQRSVRQAVRTSTCYRKPVRAKRAAVRRATAVKASSTTVVETPGMPRRVVERRSVTAPGVGASETTSVVTK